MLIIILLLQHQSLIHRTFCLGQSININKKISIFISYCRRIIPCVENATWQVEPYLEESTYPWLYPNGKGGEADPERPLALTIRDYYKQRLKSVDNRWQKDPTWIFRSLNLLQREDLRKAVNYQVKKKYENSKLCYLIYPGK